MHRRTLRENIEWKVLIPFLSYNTNNNICEAIILWSSILLEKLEKYFKFTKVFCQMKQIYTKDEQFVQQWSVLDGALISEISFLL